MSPKGMRFTIGFLGFVMFFGLRVLFFSESGVGLPNLTTDRPSYVPATAVYSRMDRSWIDVQLSDDGVAEHFRCTIYDGDTLNVARQRHFFDNPEIVGGGIYELDGGASGLAQLRRMVYFYDGYDITLRDGRLLTPVYN